MIVLTGKSLTLDDVGRIVFQNEQVVLCDRQREKLKQNREIVEEMLQDKKVMYGINTGFGKLSDHRISDEDLEALQLNLIHSHACGVGEPFDEKISKTMVLLRANALAQGYSGVRVELVQSLINLVNANICPVIPQQGSLGASGDLAPLSHLALVVMGEGEVFYQGKRMPSMDALQGNGLTPLILKAKEGLALINGTQAMTATGVVAYLEMEKLLHQSELTACMTMEGLRGIRDRWMQIYTGLEDIKSK